MHHSRLHTLVTVLVLGLCACKPDVDADLVVEGVTLIDGTDEAPRQGMTIAVSGNRLSYVGPAGEVRFPRTARRIDGDGKWIIPGLWDMHVHLTLGGSEVLPVFLAHGVTAVRDMGGDFEWVRAQRDSVRRRTRLGPRIVAAGPVLESQAFLDLLGQLAAADTSAASIMFTDAVAERVGIGSPDEAGAAVAAIAAQDADFVKFRSTADADIYRALAEAARRVGLPLAGHQPAGVPLEEVAATHLSTLEHYFLVGGSQDEETQGAMFAALVEANVAFVPTLVAVVGYRLTPDSVTLAFLDDSLRADPMRQSVSPQLASAWRAQLSVKRYEGPVDYDSLHQRSIQDQRELHTLGAVILTGSDFGAPMVLAGYSIHDELEMLVDAVGMTHQAAIISGTRLPAEVLGVADSLGTVEQGKVADFVILDANPLEAISNTRRIIAVVSDGRFLEPSGASVSGHR